MKELRIRDGREEDIPFLFQMIKDLALFERAPQEVNVNESILKADWEKSAYNFIVAEWNAVPMGISLFYPRYSTWKGQCLYLEDLIVSEEYRGKGIGKALLLATADKAKEIGAVRLDWQVIDWNTPAVEFYEKMGALIEKEWWNCKWKLD